jgi:hypothetical protein
MFNEIKLNCYGNTVPPDKIFKNWSKYAINKYPNIEIHENIMSINITESYLYCYEYYQIYDTLFFKIKNNPGSIICSTIYIHESGADYGHANALIMSQKNNKIFIYRFEPHGHETFYNHEKMDKSLIKFFRDYFSPIPFEYTGPLDYQNKVGPQNHEQDSNYYGFCLAWSILFIEEFINLPEEYPGKPEYSSRKPEIINDYFSRGFSDNIIYYYVGFLMSLSDRGTECPVTRSMSNKLL